MGMKDVLRKIKEAEQSAEKTLSSAQTESSKITADARREAAVIVTDATEESVNETQTTLDAARSKAGKEAAKVQKEGISVVEKIESSASSRKEKAVKNLLATTTSQ
jgi:ATP synthase H subunit